MEEKSNTIPEPFKKYVDEKVKEIKESLVARETSLMASLHKDIMDLDKGVKDLVFKHMPEIARFLQFHEKLKDVIDTHKKIW